MALTDTRAPALDGLVLPVGTRAEEAAHQWTRLGFVLQALADGAGHGIAFGAQTLELDADNAGAAPLLVVRARRAAPPTSGATSGLRLAVVSRGLPPLQACAPHANGASRLAGLVVAAPDPVAAARDCARRFGPARLAGVAGGLQLTLADGFQVAFLAPAAVEQRYGAEAVEADAPARCVALRFETSSLAHTRAALAPFGAWQAARRVVIAAAALPAPLLLVFEEAPPRRPVPSLPTRSRSTPERLH